MTTGFISHPDCLLHEMGEEHPDSPQRLWAICDALREARLFDLLSHYEAPKATDAAILSVHAKSYLDDLKAHAPASGYYRIDNDTAMNSHTLAAAYRAAGAATYAVDLVLEGKVTDAFCSVRPPGHHAGRDRAMGFCFFNNVAIGVVHALEKFDLERIAIADFDVHHGNGTEEIFRDDTRVLICSTFQHPFYPGEPFLQNNARIVNAPLAAGAGSKAFREAISAHWLPRLDDFRPQFIFISAGFDAHKEDPMSNLFLGDRDYSWVTQRLVACAERHANGRIVSVLEGGYNLAALGRSAGKHIRALMQL